jgi:hypothetical protein
MTGTAGDKRMVYFLLALLLLIVIGLIYRKFIKSDNPKYLLKSVILLFLVLFFTYISKVIIIHKPLFVLHLAFVMLSWIGLFFYLVKDKLNLWMILSPLASTLFFIAMALFFKENG